MYKIKPQGWKKHLDFMVLDVVCLNISFVLAYMVRNGIKNPYADRVYLKMIVLSSLVDMAVIIYNNSFKNVLKRGFYVEWAATVKHVVLLLMLMSVAVFFTKSGANYSRIVIFLYAGFYTIIGYATRILWKKRLMKKPVSDEADSMYVVTTRKNRQQVVDNLLKNSFGSYHLSGICIIDADCRGQLISGVQVTSSADDIVEYICREWVDEIFISVPKEREFSSTLVSDFVDMGIIVHQETIIDRGEESSFRIVEKIGGKTVLTTGINGATYQQAALKRAIDIVAGLAGCVATVIITLIIGPIIYIKSPGPIFFSQTRIGKNGKKFKMYKFRSMYLDAEQRKAELMELNSHKDGMMFKLDFDPRIIGAKKLADGTVKKGIGNFIRDWSIDEFPQFFNILTGTMSLVGTRPPTEDEWNKYELHHRARLAFKPGLTGMWQVSGRSNITDFEEVVKLDKQYIKNWSMGLDFRIMLQTVKAVLAKDGSR